MATIINGDCHQVIKSLPSNHFQMIYFNPPFKFFEDEGNEWDSKHLRYGELWNEMWRVLKPNGCVVIHTAQKFTYHIINTQPKYFKYFWIWKKNNKSNFLHAKIQPLRQTEEVCVFYKRQCKYNPIMIKKDKPVTTKSGGSKLYPRIKKIAKTYTHSYPTNLLEYPSVRSIFSRKIELCKYLIETYTDKDDSVLDLTCGNAISGLACKEIERKYTGIEISIKHFSIAIQNLI